MANLTLKQLREAQKENPPGDGAPGRFFGFEQIPLCPSVSAAGPSPVGSLPLQASPPVPAAVPGGFQTDTVGACPSVDGTRGYCRIFPPDFPSIADIPQAWKDEFWSCNSQWCHVEGTQRHPDFEANLLAIEAE